MTGRVRDMIMNPEETGRSPRSSPRARYYGMQTFDQALLRHVQAGRVVDGRGAQGRHAPARLQAAGGRRRPALDLRRAAHGRRARLAEPSVARVHRRRLVLAFMVVLALCAGATASAYAKTFDGKLEVVHADDFTHARAQTSWTLRTRGRRIPIRPTAVPLASSGDKVVVRGRRAGRWLEGKVIRRGGPRVKAASALGNHKVAVILINFTGDTSQPWTPAQVSDNLFDNATSSTAAFYTEQSHGKTMLTGTVFGWYTIAAPGLDCDSNLGRVCTRGGRRAAVAAYSNVMYIFPTLPDTQCGWAGLGDMPGSETWINGYVQLRVMAHELGHNFGVHHANSYNCTVGGTRVAVAADANCTSTEYGDPFTVMGMGMTRQFPAFHKGELGWLQPTSTYTVTSSGTYTIAASEEDTASTQLLRIPRTGGAPYVDVREPYGTYFDNFLSNSAIVNGVSIHWDRDTPYMEQSLLLDATPSSGGWLNSTLAQAPPSATDPPRSPRTPSRRARPRSASCSGRRRTSTRRRRPPVSARVPCRAGRTSRGRRPPTTRA